MLRRLPHLLALAALALGLTGASIPRPRLHSNQGAMPSVTGAPAVGGMDAENNCTLCHQDYANPCLPDPCNLNTPGGGVEILDLPSEWWPGTVYPLRVRLWTDSTLSYANRAWGFQITALHARDGTGAGTWLPDYPDTFSVVTGIAPFATRIYAEPNFIGIRQGLAGPVEWPLKWQAPADPAGDVCFYVAGNAGNGTDEPGLGDFVFTWSDTVHLSSVPVRELRWGALKAKYQR